MKAWRAVGIWFLVLIGNAVCEDSAVVRASVSAVCPVRSAVISGIDKGPSFGHHMVYSDVVAGAREELLFGSGAVYMCILYEPITFF
ncbi:hypothetical protein QQ045_001887 [Rhodiola kirilowii]